jgi:hypothetical protein
MSNAEFDPNDVFIAEPVHVQRAVEALDSFIEAVDTTVQRKTEVRLASPGIITLAQLAERPNDELWQPSFASVSLLKAPQAGTELPANDLHKHLPTLANAGSNGLPGWFVSRGELTDLGRIDPNRAAHNVAGAFIGSTLLQGLYFAKTGDERAMDFVDDLAFAERIERLLGAADSSQLKDQDGFEVAEEDEAHQLADWAASYTGALAMSHALQKVTIEEENRGGLVLVTRGQVTRHRAGQPVGEPGVHYTARYGVPGTEDTPGAMIVLDIAENGHATATPREQRSPFGGKFHEQTGYSWRRKVANRHT